LAAAGAFGFLLLAVRRSRQMGHSSRCDAAVDAVDATADASDRPDDEAPDDIHGGWKPSGGEVGRS
jgi:hypothetical protein